ncbi:cytochrome c [Vibrio sp. 99-8-1]|uniref:c-type cytochrome n=1 Tax=Vibrio sp. 99-8-1 TaxID=2607602 RepID=UPI001493BC85|nr:cytochrome c [Vibrio sp. 99-8-1]NOI67094.1 cytochrome c [Vibrio sp. 99-8-1]
MKIKLYTISITLIALLSFSLFAASQSTINGDTANGEQKYQQFCLACHGTKGQGDGVAAASLAKRPANLPNKINNPFKSTDQLAGKVLAGKVEKGMPAFNSVLTKQDAIDIFAYIESIQK